MPGLWTVFLSFFFSFVLPLFLFRRSLPIHLLPLSWQKYFPSQPPQCQTTLNTILNSSSDGLRRRRGLRHRNWSDDEDEGEVMLEPVFVVKSKPIPETVRGVLKRCDSNDPSRSSTPVNIPPQVDAAEDSDSPASSPPIYLTPPASPPSKQVRLLEPEEAANELIKLREHWSGGGIAGYRRTRDIYAKGQGGTAVIKRPGMVVIGKGSVIKGPGGGKAVTEGEEASSKTEEKVDEEEEADEEVTDDPKPSPRRRSPRFSPSPTPPNRSSSLSPLPPTISHGHPRSSSSPSPSPLNRRARGASLSDHHRASSPTSRTASPGAAIARRRGRSTLSSSSSGSDTSKTSVGTSGGPGGAGEGRAQPKWLKNKDKKATLLPTSYLTASSVNDSLPEDSSSGAEGVPGEVDTDSDFEDVSEGSGTTTPTGVSPMTSLTPLPSIPAARAPTRASPVLERERPPTRTTPPPSNTNSPVPGQRRSSLKEESRLGHHGGLGGGPQVVVV